LHCGRKRGEAFKQSIGRAESGVLVVAEMRWHDLFGSNVSGERVIASIVSWVVVVAGLGWATPATAAVVVPAYIDPGAGSFLLQALVAAFAGIVVTVNLYWRKIKTLLGIKPDDSEGGSESPDD